MRPTPLLALTFASYALAVPTTNENDQQQSTDSPLLSNAKALLEQVNVLTGNLGHGIFDAVGNKLEDIFHPHHHQHDQPDAPNGHDGQKNQDGYERVSLLSFSDHSLRVSTKKSTLCDPDVKQHTGYLDVTDGKHLFFWYFEAREEPEEKPLLLWLNGGPGCSSSTGLLFELGPCSIQRNTSTSTPYVYTSVNPNSWTNHANMIFLDQPTNVGFSYSSDSSTVNTSPVAALDVYAFLQLFYKRFPELKNREFHVAAESYGGTYAPNIGKVIHEKNVELATLNSLVWQQDANTVGLTEEALVNVEELFVVPLTSLILANGLTEPWTQYAAVPEYLCDGPYPVLDNSGQECANLRTKVPTCQRLIKSCYENGSRFSCVPAGLYCNSQLMGPLQNLGLNPYDVRRPCDRSPDKDGDLCYPQMLWIDEWLNKEEVREALGVGSERKFHSCNMQVNQGFFFQGDGMHNSATLLTPLLEDGIRLLVYAGNADGMCNYIGNFNWMLALEAHPYAIEFRNTTTEHWHLPLSKDETDLKKETRRGTRAGDVRAAYGEREVSRLPYARDRKNKERGGVGSYVFVNVHEAGHMVPYDQPEAALDLIGRWLNDESLAA